MSRSTAAVEPHASNFIIDAHDELFGVKINGLPVFFIICTSYAKYSK